MVGKIGKCCLCGKKYEHWGNNPAPLMKDTDKKPNRCCDECNATKVITARLNWEEREKDEM